MTAESSAVPRTKVPLKRRPIDHTRDHRENAKIALVYSATNWDQVSHLVNELRYELVDKYNLSAINIRTTQVESINEIPVAIAQLHQRNEIVFALGVVFRDSPLFEPRVVDIVTQNIASLVLPRSRLPVFDCIIVRDSLEELEEHTERLAKAGSSFAEVWAARAMDTFNYVALKAVIPLGAVNTNGASGSSAFEASPYR